MVSKTDANQGGQVTVSKKKRSKTAPLPVSAEISAKRRLASLKRWENKGKLSSDYVRGVEEGVKTVLAAPEVNAKRVQNLHTIELQKVLNNQEADPVAAARKIIAEAMPDMCRRLARIVRGAEPGWSPREQITAMRLSADIAGIVQAPGAGSDVAPLTQASLAELRATIAQGEERMRELQAQLIERQVESIPGVVVDDRTNDPVHDATPGQEAYDSPQGADLD